MNDSPRQAVGPWRLHERLGHGGNANAWRATRPGDGTAVALKVINTTKVERGPYQRFVREIEFLRGVWPHTAAGTCVDCPERERREPKWPQSRAWAPAGCRG